MKSVNEKTLLSNYVSRCLWKNEPGLYSLATDDCKIRAKAGDVTVQSYASRNVQTGIEEEIFLDFTTDRNHKIAVCRELTCIGPDRFLITRTNYQDKKQDDSGILFPGTPVAYIIAPPDLEKGKWVDIIEMKIDHWTSEGVLQIFVHNNNSATLRAAGSRLQHWGLR